MSNQDPTEDLARRFYAAFDTVDMDLATQLVAPEVRATMGGQTFDRDAWFATGLAFMSAFPDGAHDFEEVIVAGEHVVTRGIWRGTHTGDFMGIPPTGLPIAINIMHLDRWVDGRITEHHGQFDSLGMMQQLGVIPS